MSVQSQHLTFGGRICSRAARMALAVVAAACILTTPIALGDQIFDNDGNDGLWTTVNNWSSDATLPTAERAEIYLEDQTNALPMVNGIPTVTLNSGTQSPSDFRYGVGSDTDLGDLQLLISGGTLNLTADSLVGNGGDDPNIVNSTAYLTQIGGDIVITGGSGVDIKLGNSGTQYGPGAVYSISGGSLMSEGTINPGSNNTTSGPLKFQIDGSGATAIQIEDFKTESGTVADVFFSVILDAGGVTPLVVNDDFQMENVQFMLALSAVPPAGDIVLARADRLSNDNQFVGHPDGSDVSAVFGPYTYTWTINYFDSSSDGNIIDAIVLSNLRVIPEPASLALLGIGGVAFAGFAMRRRR